MKLSGSYTLDASRQQVWDALNDIDVLARTIPGCERLEQVGENEFEGTIKIGIQTIRGTYNGRIRLEDIQPPTHYRLVANGRGAGSVVDGSGTVDLTEQDGKTLLTYTGDAMVGGTLASVSQRLVEGASKQVLAQSLKAFAGQVAARNAPPEEASPAPEQALAAAEPTPALAEPAPKQSVPDTEPTPDAGAQSSPTFAPLQTPAPAWRSVVVPEDERLQPEAVIQGMAADFLRERPWFPWVIVAFLLGVIFGRRNR